MIIINFVVVAVAGTAATTTLTKSYTRNMFSVERLFSLHKSIQGTVCAGPSGWQAGLRGLRLPGIR